MGSAYLVIVFALIVFGLFTVFDISIADIFEERERRKTPTSAQKRARITVDKKSWYARYKDGLINSVNMSKHLTWPRFMNLLAVLSALGLFVGSLMDNTLLGIALMVILPITFSKYQNLRSNSYSRYLEAQVEDALGVITNHYTQSENLLMAVESSLDRLEPPLLDLLTGLANDLRLGSNAIDALYPTQGRK